MTTTREEITDTLARDGERFLLRGWSRPSAGEGGRTAIVIHHGLGEHGGRYASVARGLGELPVDLWTYDARGHGESTGKRGDADGIEQFAADLDAMLPVLLERARADKAVLIGHSMGAVVCGQYLTTRTPHPAIVAVCLSAPPVRIARTVSVRLKTVFGRALRQIAPRLTLPSGIGAEGISSDPAEVERYRSDPLVHDRLSVRLGLSLIDDPPEIVTRAARITLPALLWHGLDDPIVDVQGTRELYEAVGSLDKAMLELPGYRHESHHERPELTAQLFARVRDWLLPRIA